MESSTLKNISKELFQCLNKELDESHFDQVFKIDNPAKFKSQVIMYAARFNEACVLNNNFRNSHNQTAFIAALGSSNELRLWDEKDAFKALHNFIDELKDKWIFGFLTYDMKNDVEDISSSNEDSLAFPLSHLFSPKILIYQHENEVSIRCSVKRAEEIYDEIDGISLDEKGLSGLDENDFESRPGRQEYIKSVESLLGEIRHGNIYEVNFCRELLSETEIDPYKTAINLAENSPAPFSVFYKVDDKYLICASPERFLMKSDNNLISQPIKGTRRRSVDAEEDNLLKDQLQSDKKERAENVMIVDLVRNDLSHTAEKGSVEVAELFGIYSFPHVHQMISTVTSRLKKEIHFVQALKHCFPMGSMTGAPKLRAMKLIEKHEKFKRGLFSGSVGVISPRHNFDFNVVIRSILYNDANKTLSIRTGSAITSLCDPEKEWEECQLKASALINAISLK